MRSRNALFAGLAMLTLAAGVQAADPSRGAKVEKEWAGACGDDIQKFCPGVQAGQGRIMQCLRQHESELSDSCKARREEARERWQNKLKAAHEACQSDIGKFCPEVKPGQGRVAQCLMQHENELSASCQSQGEMIRKAKRRAARELKQEQNQEKSDLQQKEQSK